MHLKRILFSIFTCFIFTNNLISQFIACNSDFDLHVTDDPTIFEEDWFLESQILNSSLELSVAGTSIGTFVFGVSQWTNAQMYDGQTIDFEVTDTQNGISCFGQFDLFYNSNSNCVVSYNNTVQVSFFTSKDITIDWFDFIDFDTSCDKDYQATFSNQNGIFGPFIMRMNEALFIEDGASLVSNKSVTTLEVIAVDNPSEQYSINFAINRFINWTFNWLDVVNDERTYESSAIHSASVISGGGHRIYSACDSFNLPSDNVVVLEVGFEVILGTSFTVK